ncbi:glycosyltransferase family 4 protein [Bdellovibrio bacteriovorus]|uniref:glycosyltransferase family 4 protein n=1 Tax=Bdellovibrio bacteriovorus TaxID=959 RepID=UPI0035A6860F
MRIGIHSYVFYPEFFLINDLCFELAKSQHEVSVSTSLPNYSGGRLPRGYSYLGPYFEEQDGVKIFRFPVITRKTGFFFLTLNYLSNLLFSSLNIFRIPKVEVSFVFGVSPIFVALPAILQKKLLGTPVVVWLQDLWPESFSAVTGVPSSNWLHKLLENLVAYIYRNTDVVLIQSESFRENLKKYDFRGRVEYVPNWAPEVHYDNLKKFDWLEAIPAENFVFTFAGNVGHAQCLDTLLDAIKLLNCDLKVTFLIVGSGNALDGLIKRVRDEGISNVHFVGRKPIHEMPALFARSSCLYVSLSKKKLFAETIPSKVQAYLAAGRPILASLDGEGARVIQESGAGFVGPSMDANALRNNILRMLNLSFVERESLGKSGHEYYLNNFKKATLIKRIETILQETAK